MRESRIIVLFLFITLSCFGGGFQLNTQGQRALSMGGSLTALASDASISFFNPGGMSFLKNNSIVFGATAIMPKAAFLSSLDGKQVDMESETFLPFYFYATYHINEKLTAGLSINTPFGAGTKWNDNWEGRYISQKAKLQTVFFQPTLSYKFSEKFSAGAGFVYATGKAELTKALPVQSTSTTDGSASLEGKANGTGFTFGAFIMPNDKTSFGVSYRSKIKMDVDDGDATFTNIPSALAEVFPAATNFTTTLRMPSIISIAIAHRFNDNLRAHFEINYTGWKVYDALVFKFDDQYTELNNSGTLNRQYKNVVAVRLGGEWDITQKFTLRTGVAYDQTPVEDGYVTPDLPDANKYAFTGGLGFNVNEKITIDASYAFESIKERQDKNFQSNLDGSFKTIIHAIGLGVSYKF